MANGENKPILSQTVNTREPIEFKQTVRIEAESGSQIEKVHNIYALPRITNKDVVEDVMTISGESSIFALYENEEGKFHELKSDVVFEEKTNMLGASALLLEAEMVSYDILGFDKSSITVNCLFKVNVMEISNTEVGMQLSDEVALEKNSESVVISKTVGASASSFTESGEIEIAGETALLLSREAKVIINNAFAGLDAVTIEGNIIFKALVDVNDKIQEINKSLPFKQEVECFGANPGNVTISSAYVSNIMAGVDNSGENSNILSFTCEVAANSICYVDETIENVVDAYSTAFETSLTVETVNHTNIKQVGYNQKEVSFSADITSKLGVDEVVGVINPKLVVEKTTAENYVSLEGVVELVVVYKNNNEENTQTFEAVCPITAEISLADEYNDADDFSVVVESFKLKSGAAIEFEGKINYTEKKAETLQIVYVSDAIICDEARENKAAIKVYTTEENETLFDIAKNLGVTVDYLLSQNPSLASGVLGGEKVYVYLPLEINF